MKNLIISRIVIAISILQIIAFAWGLWVQARHHEFDVVVPGTLFYILGIINLVAFLIYKNSKSTPNRIADMLFYITILLGILFMPLGSLIDD